MTHHTNQMTRSQEAYQKSTRVEVSTEIKNGRSKEFHWTRRSAIILGTFGFVGVLQGSCYSLLAPFFPLVAEQKGNSAWQFGLVFGIYQLIVFLTAPIHGKLLSSHVPAKVMLCTGMFVDGACCCLMGSLVLSPPGETFFGLAMSIRIVESLGFTATLTCCYAVVCAEYPNHIEVAVPLTELAFGLGLIVGPSLGGVLYQFGGFVLPFVLVGSLLVAASFVTVLIFPDIETPHEDSAVSMRDVCDWRVFVNLLMVVACFITLGFNEATLAIHLQQFLLPPSLAGLIFMLGGGTYALSSFAFGQACKHIADPRYVCLLGGISMLTCFAVIGPPPFFNFAPTVTIICISQLLLGIGVASYYIGTFMHAIKHAVDYKGLPNNLSTFAILSGLFSSSFSLGLFIGPIIGGALLDRFGYAWSSTFVFGLQAVVMVMLVFTLICENVYQRREDETRHLLKHKPSYQT
ncbi:MFS-type transporter SLC18B1-like isoform X2 [Ornithodoros turicata]|uniref:MFS-type transporter SLC18B1-like isoform X2 n=1 Tax=Ornithodoros turicata TaxID=34597 RepID=UPI00313986F0